MTGRHDRAHRTPAPTVDLRTQPLLPEQVTAATVGPWLDRVAALTPVNLLEFVAEDRDTIRGGMWAWDWPQPQFGHVWRGGIDQERSDLAPQFRDVPEPTPVVVDLLLALAALAVRPWEGAPWLVVTPQGAWWQASDWQSGTRLWLVRRRHD